VYFNFNAGDYEKSNATLDNKKNENYNRPCLDGKYWRGEVVPIDKNPKHLYKPVKIFIKEF
jgi:hypothetical protein